MYNLEWNCLWWLVVWLFGLYYLEHREFCEVNDWFMKHGMTVAVALAVLGILGQILAGIVRSFE
jgi:hypothetical protein